MKGKVRKLKTKKSVKTATKKAPEKLAKLTKKKPVKKAVKKPVAAPKQEQGLETKFSRTRLSVIRRRILRRRRRLRAAPIARVIVKQPEKPAELAPEDMPKRPVRTSGKRQVLLCPGPVNLSVGVKAALSNAEICHREPEFSDMLQSVRAKLLHVLSLDSQYAAAIFSGSGTAALESAVASSTEHNKKILVINNGVYGSRIAQLARIHGLNLVEVRSVVTEAPDLERINAVLKRESSIATVAMVHHETSTGLLNPVEEVGALVKKYRRRFLVDAISSLGAEKLDFKKSHIDICVGSAGKALHGVSGLSFVLLKNEEAARIAKGKAKSMYLDLTATLKAQEEGEPAFTPAIVLVSAFHAALNELVKEGLKSRIAKYAERAEIIRTGFKKQGLKFLLDERLMSHSLTTFMLPKGISYEKFHNSLKRQGFVIYAGQSELKGSVFRIAHMGQLLQSDLKDLLAALKYTLTVLHAA